MVTLKYGVAFSLGSATCTGTGTLSCSVSVTFAPKTPGLQRDAIVIKSSAGAVLARQFIHGIATGPRAAFFPGVISTALTSGQPIPVGGVHGATTTLQNPGWMAADPAGNVFVSDTDAGAIIRIDHDTGAASVYASISSPAAIAIDPGGALYAVVVVYGAATNQILRIDPETQASSVAAGTGQSGYSGDNGPATAATLNSPGGLATDADGNLFIADTQNQVIRRVDAATGIITTFAGTANPTSIGTGDGGPANAAAFLWPDSLAVDSAGNVYVTDQYPYGTLRVIEHATGIIWTLLTNTPGIGTAPGGAQPINGDSFAMSSGLAVDDAGDLFLAGQNAVMEVFVAEQKFATFAGGGNTLANGDGGPATSGVLQVVGGLATDGLGNVFIADSTPSIRKVATGAGALNFPQTAVGQTAAAQTIELENEGNTPLGFVSAHSTTAFPMTTTASGACSSAIPIPVGESCSLAVAFSPVTPFRTSGTLSVITNSANQAGAQMQAALTGGPPLGFAPESLSFRNQEVGVTSGPQPITITNMSANSLWLTLGIEGANAADFVETGNCPYPPGLITPGASCSLGISFRPGATGARTAALVVTTSVDSLPISLALSGTGGLGTGCLATAFSANPNPIVSATSAGVTTITAAATCNFDIRTGSASGAVLASGTAGTPLSVATGNTVTDGTIFYLQPSGDTSAADTLASQVIRVQASATLTWHFDSLAVNTSSAPASLNLQFSNLSAPPSLSLRFGTDFILNNATCGGSATMTCQVSVTFRPIHPGLRQDAVIARDSSGNVLMEAYLSGIGLGTRWSVTPGAISTVASGIASSSGSFGYAGLAADPAGNLFVSNTDGTIHRVAPSGTVSLIAGQAGSYSYGGDGGPALSARFNSPSDVALDGAGNLYIADSGNNIIRKVDTLTGIVTTVAGIANPSNPYAFELYSGDGGPATAATLSNPLAVVVDRDGDLFLSDSYNNVVRRVDAETGIITTIAGTGTLGYSGDNGPATAARLDGPAALSFDDNGNLFIVDGGYYTANYVRRVDAQTGIITTVAGNGQPYSSIQGPFDSGLLAVNSAFGVISGMATDAGGGLYLAGWGDGIARIDASGIVSTIAGNSTANYAFAQDPQYAGDGGPATQALLGGTAGMTLDGEGNLYFVDAENQAIRKVTAAPAAISFVSKVPGPAWPQTLSLNNTGNQPLSVLDLAVLLNRRTQSPAGLSDFQWVTNCGLAASGTPQSLVPGADCQITINFSPAHVGTAVSGLFSIAMESQGRGLQRAAEVPLSGYATAGSTCAAASFFLTADASNTGTTTGSAVVNADANCDYDIRVGSAAGTLLAQSNGLGAFATGNIVTDGLEFYLQKRGDTSSKGTLAVAIGTAGAGTCVVSNFSSNPNPSSYSFAGLLVNAACDYDVREGSPNGSLAGQGTGLSMIGATLATPDNLFYLQRTGSITASGTLAVLDITYSPNSCVAQEFFASPAPIFASGPTGSTTINILTTCNWDLRAASPSGRLLASGVSGTQQQIATGNTVMNGMKFYLQKSGDTTPAGTLTTLAVEVIQQ